MRRVGIRAVNKPQLVPPRVEQLESAPGIGYLIAEVVRPATISVDIVEMLMQPPRKQPTHDIKIFVVMSGQPSRITLRLGDSTVLPRQVSRDFQFGSGQH